MQATDEIAMLDLNIHATGLYGGHAVHVTEDGNVVYRFAAGNGPRTQILETDDQLDDRRVR